jgi:hypothetical protein
MDEPLFYSKLVTKSMEPVHGEDRFFEGFLTVQIKDKQGEITIVDELMKVLPIWMDRGAPISDTHSNRIVGKGINYAKTEYKTEEGSIVPAIKIVGKIHKNYELDEEIWSKIKSGEYKGLSFGGATKTNREPKLMKDGSIAYQLKDLEHYEVAVCRDPAVPLALITDHNPIAKAITDNIEERADGKMVIKCDKFGCYVTKPIPDGKGGRGNFASCVANNKDKRDPEAWCGSIQNAMEGKSKAEEGQIGAGQRGLGHDEASKQGSGDTHTITEIKDDDDKENEEGKEGVSDAENDTNHTASHTQDVDEGGMGKKHKSGYQTEDGNNQLGGQGKADKKDIKEDKIFINHSYKDNSNDMVEENSQETVQKVEAKDEKVEAKEDKKHEEAEKAFSETVKSSIDTLTEVIQSVAETQKSVDESLKDLSGRVKALETPTDLPLSPKGTEAKDDVGAKVTVPDTYQSNSIQAGLDDDRSGEKKPSGDKGGLKMQQKVAESSQTEIVEKAEHTFTTETPRPNAALETVDKSQKDFSPILKDAREGGYEGLSNVARHILGGKYYQPSPDEVGAF